MLDLNHLLFFAATATPLAVLAKTLRRDARLRAWRLAAIAVLIVAALSWFFFRDRAGYIAGGAWLVLLFIPAIGMRRVAELTQRKRFRSARYLASVLRVVHPSDELRHEIELLRMYESRPDLAAHLAEPAQDRHRPFLDAPAVLVIALLNIVAFIFGNYVDLDQLGALDLSEVAHRHQYWRLITAAFLHFNFLHLASNVLALYVLGPQLERAFGSLRFLLCYFFAALGASIGFVLLARAHVAHGESLVGASGPVMGIVGAWAAYSMRNHSLPLAKQRLMNVLFIVAIQTAFDLTTPQISMAAHLCGLVAGFVIGLLISPRKKMSILA